MKDSIRLGRVGGVTIGLNWSLVLIILLLAFGLADNRFPADAPGAGNTAYAVAGALTAASLLVGVLLHELGHAVVARRFGMTVDGITLSWLGGVTRIEGETSGPGPELAIGIVGPLISFLLGGALWLVRLWVEGGGGHHALVVSALGWLAVINVALAVFNLVPASPLDGGRVLHAVVWRLTGDRWKATRGASGAGVLLGSILAVVGFSRLLAGDELDGFVLAVLGFWIISSARGEQQAGQVQAVLSSLRVADLMRPVGAAPGWITVRTFIEGYDSPRPGWVWLLERWGEPGYGGVVCGDDLRRLPPQRWDMLRPADLAIPADLAAAARAQESVLDALRRTKGDQVLLVIEGGRTVGAVLPGDVQALLRTGQRPLPGHRRPAAGAGAGGPLQ